MKIEKNSNGKIICDDNNQIIEINDTSICSMNFWGFPLSYMDILEKNFINFLSKHGSELKSEWLIPEIVDYSINYNNNQFHVLSTESEWFGVTYPEDKQRVMNLLANLHSIGEYPEKLWN